MIKDEMASAIAQHIPKLTKQQLSEILFLSQAWANGIPLVNLKRQAIGIEGLDSDLKALTLLNSELELKNYELQEEVKKQSDRIHDKDATLKKVLVENRALRNRFFMSTGVKG